MKLQQLYARVLYRAAPLIKRLRLTSLLGAHVELIKHNSKNGYSQSVYNIKLVDNWNDATFKMAIGGLWGFKLYDLLLSQESNFSFVDVGANFGSYSLIAAQNPNCKSVYSIEPNPCVFKQLLNNIEINQRQNIIRPCRYGIAESNGTMEISYRENNLGVASFREKGNSGNIKELVDVKNFEAFDSIALNTKGQDIIVKIDVEGFEPQVIKQLSQSKLSLQVKGIFIEVTPSWVSKNELDSMFLSLKEMGFREIWRGGNDYQYDAYYIK